MYICIHTYISMYEFGAWREGPEMSDVEGGSKEVWKVPKPGLGAKCPTTQPSKRIQNVDPPKDSIFYAIHVLPESRVVGSTFWILPGVWVEETTPITILIPA